MIKYRNIRLSDFPELAKIWKEDVVPTTIYKDLSEEQLRQKIMNPFYDISGSVVVLHNQEIIGFGVAYKTSSDVKIPGFLGVIVIKTKYRRQGYGTQILKLLETYLKSSGKTFIRTYFASPLNFEWMVWHTNHYHTGAPAIPYHSSMDYFLQHHGYQLDGQLDGYHMNLDAFEFKESIQDKLKDNENLGYQIEYYDKDKHKGLLAFFERMQHQSWKEVAIDNENLEYPLPMLVVTYHHHIVGWTGPLSVTPDKKGSFGGIGIDPEHRGKGLGKILFSRLCAELKAMGATYMTLFTGSENPAKNIYLETGFEVVQSFSILRKNLI